MVPHSLFVSSDRHVDLALDLLTLIVGGGLLATAAVLLFLWLRPAAPAADGGEMGPPAWASMSEVLRAPPRLEFEVRLPEVLRPEVRFAYGATIFRCEHRGTVTYTDRPCPVGSARTLSVRPS
jgi:hypothetical protein